MSSTLTAFAYAKVNLHLAVGSPYPDGYHPIESIFSQIDLADRIEMRYSTGDTFSIEVTGLEAYCKRGRDTLTRAAQLWYERSGVRLQVRVYCEKHIPVKAGLGGGSSDAAALLLMLQKVAGDKALSLDELQDVALRVGSDVPFFLSGFSCALVEGRGDRVTELSVGSKAIVVVQPKHYAVSTKSAFARLDEVAQKGLLSKRVPIQEVISLLKRDPSDWNGVFCNDFELCTSFSEFYSSLARIASGYKGFGSLSGSGSCWYFISENSKSVVELSKEVEDQFSDSVHLWCTTLK